MLRSHSWAAPCSRAATAGPTAARQARALRCTAAHPRQQRQLVLAACSGSAGDEAASNESSSSDRGGTAASQRRRRGGGTGLRREDLAFFIARSDLTWEQPWRFEQSAALAELQLREQGVAALDDDVVAQQAQQAQHATAAFTVQAPGGLGALVVRGRVAATVPLRCEFCGEAFSEEVAEPFDGIIHFEGASAILAAAGEAAAGGSGGAELAANELIFDADSSLCDIAPLITDAVVGALPSVCLCGGASCRQHAGRKVVWSSTPPGAAAAGAASPFAKLLASGESKQASKGRRRKS